MGAFAWVTLATNDSYSLGALVLAHSLKQAGTAHQLAVLVTPGVTKAMRDKLGSVFNVVQEVNILDSRDEANLKLLKRPELDADTLVLQNSDELFEREELSAAPDVGWPDCFNSGVFVYRPSNDTYDKLIQFAIEKGSFDGGDQGLLNLYFSDWAHKDISKHLPFIYNMCSTACYSYLPAFKQFGANAKIIHFIGAQKPWLQYFNTETKRVQPSGDSAHLQEILQRWWDIFCSLIHPLLSPAMAGLAGAFSQLTLGVARTPEQDALENALRKQAWEVGNIDYLGKDSFANIWSKITETLGSAPSAPAPAESQSQSALQEEAIPVQPHVLPTDSSETSVEQSQIDSSESKNIVEAQDIQQALQEPVDPPQQEVIAQPVISNTPETAASFVETAKTQSAIEEKSSTPVATPTEVIAEPLVCPIPIKEKVDLPKEPEVIQQVPIEPIVVADKQLKAAPESPQPPKEVAPIESQKIVESSVITKDSISSQIVESPTKAPESETKSVISPAPIESAPTSAPSAPTKVESVQPSLVSLPTTSSPKTKITAATPPITPGTPPVEKTKQALVAEASIPDTPPPTEGGSTPTPPPRKTDKPKKAAAKPKK